MNEIDWDNLLEEIEGLGQSKEDQLTSRLIILVAHLLKWRFQPSRRSKSWVLMVREQRRRIERLIDRNPSLKGRLGEIFADAYPSAIDRAVDETGLEETTFTKEASIDFDTAMSEAISWPEKWTQD